MHKIQIQMRWLASAVLVAGTIGFLAGSAFTEDPAPDEAEMMKMIMELATPGAAHQQLADMAGDWDVDATMWMTPGEPIASKATSKGTMALGGRYLATEYSGTFQDMPFNGRGVLAYDNFKKQYQSVWFDSMSTSLSLETGSMSDDGKTLTMNGAWEGPMGKVPFRNVYAFESKDRYTLTAYHTMGGEEAKTMELVFTRSAPKAAAPAPAPARGRCCPPGTRGPGY
jgi:hypothetical protein